MASGVRTKNKEDITKLIDDLDKICEEYQESLKANI